PDLFVVKDCDLRRRRVFKLWEEKRTPCFVLETTSKKTCREDRGKKMKLYAQLGIPEYSLYDPEAEWLKPSALVGYRLAGDEYVMIEPAVDGGVVSEQLGLTFRLEDGRLALFETARGKRLLTAEERVAEESAARQALEEEVTRLRAALGRRAKGDHG